MGRRVRSRRRTSRTSSTSCCSPASSTPSTACGQVAPRVEHHVAKRARSSRRRVDRARGDRLYDASELRVRARSSTSSMTRAPRRRPERERRGRSSAATARPHGRRGRRRRQHSAARSNGLMYGEAGRLRATPVGPTPSSSGEQRRASCRGRRGDGRRTTTALLHRRPGPKDAGSGDEPAMIVDVDRDVAGVAQPRAHEPGQRRRRAASEHLQASLLDVRRDREERAAGRCSPAPRTDRRTRPRANGRRRSPNAEPARPFATTSSRRARS